MAQPSGQVNLATAHNTEYFWYAQGSSGIWDARNGALLTKTGSAAMSTESGVNVALGDGSTYYSLASSVTLNVPFTLRFRARKNSGQTTNSMAGGNDAGTNSFQWLDSGAGVPKFRIPWSGGAYADVAGSAITTTSLSTLSLSLDASRNYVMYQDNTNIGSGTISSGSGTLQFIINRLLRGYSGGSFSLVGAFEFAHLIPSYTDASGIAALNADPYGVLAASSPVTTISATTSNAVGAITSTGYVATSITGINATTANAVGAITSVGNTSSGTFTSEPLRDNVGNLIASKSLNHVALYNDTTGALVVRKTGLSTNASGIFSFTDAAITSGATYRVDWEDVDGKRRMPRKAAT